MRNNSEQSSLTSEDMNKMGKDFNKDEIKTHGQSQESSQQEYRYMDGVLGCVKV